MSSELHQDIDWYIRRVEHLKDENESLKRSLECETINRVIANRQRDKAEAIIAEIAASVPLKHTLAATRTGAALIEYVKQAIQKAAADR